MIPSRRGPTHPGAVLQDGFLGPLGLTKVNLAAHVGVSVQRINETIRGKRGITPATAWLLAQAFGRRRTTTWRAHAQRAASASPGKPAERE